MGYIPRRGLAGLYSILWASQVPQWVESACSAADASRHEFVPQPEKMPWRKTRQSTAIFLPGARNISSLPGLGKFPWRKDRLPTSVFLGFPGGSDSKEFPCNMGDLGSIPGLGRSPGGGHGNPLQYSCLENPHGQRNLVGHSPWDHKESDMTDE